MTLTLVGTPDPGHDEHPPITKPRITYAALDPAAVQTRRDWWRNGRPGHWPGCPCESCTTRRTWNGDGT